MNRTTDHFDENYYLNNGQSGDRPALWMYERLWKRYCKAKGPVLDFGGGVGQFAKRLSAHAKVYAVESNTFSRHSIARNAPEAIVAETLEDLPSEEVGSVVGLHVLEHIADDDLKVIFEQFRRISRPEVRCLFVMPDLDGAAHKLKGEKWSGYSDPTHINLKGATAWGDFLQSEGFEPIKVFSDGFYDFPYARGPLDWLGPEPLRIAATGLQFVVGRAMLKPGQGENVVFVLKKKQ